MNLNPFIDLIVTVLSLYSWVLIIAIILNWLIAFNIINPYQTFVSKVNEVLYRLTEPLLRQVRRYIPPIGGIDISPIIVFILIRFLINVLYTYFYTY